MLKEPLFIWAEKYVMQISSGGRKAVSTDVKLLDDEILTTQVLDAHPTTIVNFFVGVLGKTGI